VTTDLTPVISRAEATTRLDRVRKHVTQAWDDLVALYNGRAWVTLGYHSWDDLCDEELDGARIALPVTDRREVVGNLREQGLSTRAIASAVGVDDKTVRNDLAATAEHSAVARPSVITGLDGRTRPAHVTTTSRTTEATKVEQDVDLATGEILEPTPRSTPRRPLTDQFFDAAYDLSKVTERLERLVVDDRFPQNADKVAAKHRNDLVRAVDALQGVLHRLPSA